MPGNAVALEIETKDFGDWAGVARLGNLRRIVLHPIKPPHLIPLADLGARTRLDALWLGEIRVEALTALAEFPHLRHLSLHWAPKLANIDVLARLTKLETLALWDLPKLPNLDALGELPNLRELTIETAPGRDSHGPQRFPSFSPLACLKNLERLKLVGIAAKDESLEPLHGLTKLRHVHLANAFPMEQFARLAAALPAARGNFAEPVVTLPGFVECTRCRARKVMLLGLRTRLKCPTCDSRQIAAHVAVFERIRTNCMCLASHSSTKIQLTFNLRPVRS
ncbi:MAG: hypothetical protein ACKVS9_06520 [Phycisphaerae bacterium]